MSRKIIAILRGVQPDEAVDIGHALVEAGITTLEVPLNSPSPMQSIGRLAKALPSDIKVGAGTVLTLDQVKQVADQGGALVVSPNVVPKVIAKTKDLGMASYPGVLTPTECFAALESGADGLKFFPSNVVGPNGVAAIGAVLPKGTEIYAVGGVGPKNFADWVQVGVTGFGIGSSLYRPGDSAPTVSEKARKMVAAYDAAVG